MAEEEAAVVGAATSTQRPLSPATATMIDLGLKRISQLVHPSTLPWKAIHVPTLPSPRLPPN